MRWRATAAALVVAATWFPFEASATAGPVLVLTTSGGSSHAVVTFAKAITVKRSDWNLRMRWSGCGRYRGYYLQPVSRGSFRGTGLVDVARFEYGRYIARMPVRLGEQAREGSYLVTIPAGRYRAHVLGEGRCEVRVPIVSGIAGERRVAARSRTPVQYAERDLNHLGAPPGSPQVGAASFAVKVTPQTYVVSVGHRYETSSTTPPLGLVEPCIDAAPAGPCLLTAEGVSVTAQSKQVETAGGVTHSAASVFSYALPGVLTAGTQYGKVRCDCVSGPRNAVAATLAFTP